LSVKNGAELLDRLIKDIVSESASTYVSVLQQPEEHHSKAFSLLKFIPLLQERISVYNPYTRTFLVGWITLLDSIPDLELVTYLPSFLGGLFKFLGDSNQDVYTTTQAALNRFLAEIKKIARLKRSLARKRTMNPTETQTDTDSDHSGDSPLGNHETASDGDAESVSTGAEDTADDAEDWVPGQDVNVEHGKMLEILVTFLGGQAG
jgi:vacuole morphology and inheritance protein 14